MPSLGFVGVIGVLFVPTVFLIELIAVGWRDSSLRQLATRITPSAGSDLFMYLTSQLGLISILTKLFTLGLAAVSGLWINAEIHKLFHFNLSVFPHSFVHCSSAAFFPGLGLSWTIGTTGSSAHSEMVLAAAQISPFGR